MFRTSQRYMLARECFTFAISIYSCCYIQRKTYCKENVFLGLFFPTLKVIREINITSTFFSPYITTLRETVGKSCGAKELTQGVVADDAAVSDGRVTCLREREFLRGLVVAHVSCSSCFEMGTSWVIQILQWVGNNTMLTGMKGLIQRRIFFLASFGNSFLLY